MPRITTKDGVTLHVNDWGNGRPVVLIHGWPLSGDSWEHQAVSLAEAGFRVISYDRRGFGKSEQPFTGYDYDVLAEDLAAIMDELALTDAALVGFSMGGGEVARYMLRHAGKGVSRVAFIAAVTPMLLKTEGRKTGITLEQIAEMKAGIRKDRPAFLQTLFKTFYGNGLLGGGVSQGMLDWSLMMAMQASPKATLDCIDAFGTTDFRADMAAISVPALIVHGTADQTVPIDISAREAVKLIPQATLIEYDGGAHGITATHAQRLSDDLIAFLSA